MKQVVINKRMKKNGEIHWFPQTVKFDAGHKFQRHLVKQNEVENLLFGILAMLAILIIGYAAGYAAVKMDMISPIP